MELVAIWLYFYVHSRRANHVFWLVVATRNSSMARIRLIQVEQVVKRSIKTKYKNEVAKLYSAKLKIVLDTDSKNKYNTYIRN